jgi:hypothetical protein
MSKIAIYLSLGLHKGRPSYRRSIPVELYNRKPPAFQNNTILRFFLAIFALVIRICIPNADTDPDPADENQCRSTQIRKGNHKTGGELTLDCRAAVWHDPPASPRSLDKVRVVR